MESEKESVKDLIVDVRETEVQLALMDNHKLIEFNRESLAEHSFTVGDVFLGKVKKIMPALNAAFVDIGDEKEAFIHYLDLGLYFDAFDQFVKKSNPNTNAGDLFSSIELGPILAKEGQIENHLKPGQMVIVQIVKEPISTRNWCGGQTKDSMFSRCTAPKTLRILKQLTRYLENTHSYAAHALTTNGLSVKTSL